MLKSYINTVILLSRTWALSGTGFSSSHYSTTACSISGYSISGHPTWGFSIIGCSIFKWLKKSSSILIKSNVSLSRFRQSTPNFLSKPNCASKGHCSIFSQSLPFLQIFMTHFALASNWFFSSMSPLVPFYFS